MKKLIPVTIRRKNWLRGGKGSMLLNKNGSKCCLGFVCTAMGVKANVMKGRLGPGELKMYIPGLTTRSHNNTESCDLAMAINDDAYYPSIDREVKLKKIAKNMGYKFTFI